jgi:hypothetical protein
MGGEKKEHEVKKADGLGVRILQRMERRHACSPSGENQEQKSPRLQKGFHNCEACPPGTIKSMLSMRPEF